MLAPQARKMLDFTRRSNAKMGLAGSHRRQLVSAPLHVASATAGAGEQQVPVALMAMTLGLTIQSLTGKEILLTLVFLLLI